MNPEASSNSIDARPLPLLSPPPPPFLISDNFLWLPKVRFLSQIYRKELEEIEDFGGLSDFVDTFHFKRGKDEDDDDEPTCGELKVSAFYFNAKGCLHSQSRLALYEVYLTLRFIVKCCFVTSVLPGNRIQQNYEDVFCCCFDFVGFSRVSNYGR